MSDPAGPQPTSGFAANFSYFTTAQRGGVLQALRRFVSDASPQQQRAWRDAIPRLQQEVAQVVAIDAAAGRYHAILEYRLPMELRRIDAVFLLRDAVVVIELKGKREPSDADIDQAHAYARDLRCYHAECAGRPVQVVLVPTLAQGHQRERRGVHVCGPDALDELVARFDREDLADLARRAAGMPPVDVARFLDPDAYRPLPTLVRAARELFHAGTVRRIHRAAAATDPAVELLARLAHDAARTGRRKLVLLAGVPGAGKTLVGLRLAHAHFLDDLAVERGSRGKPTAPAVFLSGNAPLVEVLQHELRGAGGAGRTFVRGVKQYCERFARNPGLVPAEHVLVFDEAQRAYDAAMVAEKHGYALPQARSEPDSFIEFAERVPGWCLVLALIGSGQEINRGEEAGVRQWAAAIAASGRRAEWDVHGPVQLAGEFAALTYECHAELSLDTGLRSHLSHAVHRFVAGLVRSPPDDAASLAALAGELQAQGHDLRITRDLQAAKAYLRERYVDAPEARFGILASSRDRDLPAFGVDNDFQATKRVRFGPWYGDDERDPAGRSGRLLRDCVNEFGAQGLELDAVLLAWGGDFRLADGRWSIDRARRYRKSVAAVRDAAQLRANAYRVLLTRTRDATVAFVPALDALDETHAFLVAAGFRTMAEADGNRTHRPR